MKIKLTALLILLALCLVGCGEDTPESIEGNPSDLSGTEPAAPADISELGVYDGLFEEESTEINIECISGTEGAYILDGTTLTFKEVTEESAYSVSGKLLGNIVIDVGDEYKFDLELHGLSLICDHTNPITVLSGDEVSIKAKKDTKNYVYDMRESIGESEELYSGAIHSEVDLEIGGKGEFTLVSKSNNGIHSKDDLEVKNLTLTVACSDNALKGNDSVEITDAKTVLIAVSGDCIKTSASDISEKGNQRGNVTVSGGDHSLYSARDGIDAAHSVIIDGADTVLNIYTDKYSGYSSEVSDVSSDSNYIRFHDDSYYFSVKYYNSDDDYLFVNAEYHSTVSGTRTNYYYYSYPKRTEYSKQQFFIYESESDMGQEESFLVASDYLTPNTDADTFAITARGNQLSYSWTNYTTKIQEGGFGGPGGHGGPGGGMNNANNDKNDYSSKGIKAANEIIINEGKINVTSYDDAIHANNDSIPENGASPLGNVTVNGGIVTVTTNDDGLHADGVLTIKGGRVNVKSSYEGIEGNTVNIFGGNISVIAKDDGINGTCTSETAISVSGGRLYIYCSGDGIDANSRVSYGGILFSGGETVVISSSSGNSAIDTESGYSYTGGTVIALMPSGGMSSEATHCKDFDSIGKSTRISLSSGEFLITELSGACITVKMPLSLSATVVVLGDCDPGISAESDCASELDENGVAWE